jgi:hypothetical protein
MKERLWSEQHLPSELITAYKEFTDQHTCELDSENRALILSPTETDIANS